MSYRTIKKLLGETSLERKCRFLLGAGMLVLIASSFWFYSFLNSYMFDEQNLRLARSIVSEEFVAHHWEWQETAPEFRDLLERFREQLRPESMKEMSIRFVAVSDQPDVAAYVKPLGEPDYIAMDELRQGRAEYVEYDEEAERYQYFGAIPWQSSCASCHHTRLRGAQDGDLVAMSVLSLPLRTVTGELDRNRAYLVATALVTAFLAMLGAYAIVRYVIVKPVLHLKDVSDEIARGNLDLRADIRTGDEFEELSHAFNRMLRHLVTVQDELKEVNYDLDGKVDELAHVNLRLYEMNNLKDEFLATMSHELRTPLNSILGFSDVLAEAGNLDDRQKRYINNIQTSGRQLLALVNDVLDLAKIESGKMDLQIAEFDLSELIERQVSSLQPMAEKKNIELTWSVDPALELVQQDRGKLQQILNNLLSNALKFTPEGGRVVLIARPHGTRQMEILVRDTGIGIRLEEQEQIFEKFRQGKAIPGQRDALTREFGGTGLGLSIVKELSRLLGGEILLESEFGRGSTFWIRIPRYLEPGLQAPRKDPLSQLAGLNRLRPASEPAETPGWGFHGGFRAPVEPPHETPKE